MSREVFLTMIEGNTPCVVRIEGLEILFLCGTAGLKAAEENSAKQGDSGCGNCDTRSCQFLEPAKKRDGKIPVATLGSLDSGPDRSVEINSGLSIGCPALQESGEIVVA